MARKYVDIEEAAKMLGLTPDKVNDLRLKQELSAYRDGTTWKFRPEEIERYLADNADKVEGQDEYGLAGPDSGGNLDSILLSEVELGGSGALNTSSTIIGKSGGPDDPESDIKLASEADDDLTVNLGPNSDVRLASNSNVLKPGAEVKPKSGSDVLKPGSDVKPGSGLNAKFDDLDNLDLDLSDPGGSGISIDDRTIQFNKGDDLSLDDDDDDLGLGKESLFGKTGSSKGGGSAIDLSGDDDDDLVLGGSSGPGSDLTRAAGNSGISLVDRGDSGLNLEEAPALGGTAIQMGGGDDDMILLEEAGDSEGATQLKADDDFLLTPLDESGTDDSDSGSQVIALDSEVDFDDAAATQLGSRAPAMSRMLEEDSASSAFGMDDMDAGMGVGVEGGLTPAPDLAAAGAPAVAAPQVIEAPYSIFNVLSLGLCVVLLMVSGMMSYDLLRNMWSWDGPHPVNSSLMDMVVNAL